MEIFPMRINKYLAHTGISTRLGGDELIRKGSVFINGKVAKLGDKVTETDIVKVEGESHKIEHVYLAYNKPINVITANPEKQEKDIVASIKFRTKVFPVGRLDKDSHGLIILTNDGRITDRLLNPDNDHQKEYVVELNKKFTPSFLKHMSSGLQMEHYTTKKAVVKKISDRSFSIILTEGKNRQIRKMTEKLGYKVIDLKRVRIQNILLGKIPSNSYREIRGEEKNIFLSSIGLTN